MRYSVIIPCHNRPEQLAKAITSCIQQTFGDLEIIVVDDFSDISLEDQCELKDHRIIFVRNEKNMGAAASRNRGLQLAQGDYVSFLDSDDVYFPDRFLKIEELLSDTGATLLFHFQERVFDHSEGRPIFEMMPSRRPFGGERLDDFMLLNGNYIQTNSYVIERRLAQAHAFDAKCIAWEDNKYLLECWLDCKSYTVLPETLSRYNDERRTTRLSKQRDRARHFHFLQFVKDRCSPQAVAGLQALVDAELSIIRHPVRVAKSLFYGKYAGIKSERIAIYFCRSLIGFDRTEAILYKVRSVKRSKEKVLG